MTEREKAVATMFRELAAARKRTPIVQVEQEYRFEGPDGERSLLELFDGRTQLILYRFFVPWYTIRTERRSRCRS